MKFLNPRSGFYPLSNKASPQPLYTHAYTRLEGQAFLPCNTLTPPHTQAVIKSMVINQVWLLKQWICNLLKIYLTEERITPRLGGKKKKKKKKKDFLLWEANTLSSVTSEYYGNPLGPRINFIFWCIIKIIRKIMKFKH